MRKVRRRILVAVIIVVIVAAGIALYIMYPMLSMTPAETGAVAGTEIFAIRNARNAVYFVPASDGYIMVDAGSDEAGIEKSMQDNEIGIASVKWILLTHTDYDHVAALPLFPEAEIYMSETELLDASGKRNFPISTDGIGPLTDEQEISLGGITVKGISAPGHRTGHMVYLIDGKFLFTGYAFRRSGTTLHPHPFSDDEDAALRTIEMLTDVIDDSEIVLTGHYGYYRP